MDYSRVLVQKAGLFLFTRKGLYKGEMFEKCLLFTLCAVLLCIHM